MSKAIVVRDRAGNPVQIPVSSIPEEIRPDNWFENAYWMHRPDSDRFRPVIGKLLEEQRLTGDEIRMLAQYVVDYAASIAVAVYLFSGQRDTGYYGGLVRQLRQMRDEATKRKHVMRMLQLCLEHSLDML